MTGAVVLDEVDAERGARLRRLRRDRQLSQEALGGGRFSPSYVSHLERGRRHLTEEMVDFFADRLGVIPDLILADSPPPASPHSAASAMARQEVQRTLAQHRFAAAARTAQTAIRDAETRGDQAEAWSLSLLRAKALVEDDQYVEAAAVAMACAEHTLTVGHPALGVEALLIAARGAREEGELRTALERAERAARALPPEQLLDLEAESAAMRIGCLMELDRTAEAVEVAEQLAGFVERIPSDHVRGRSEWVLGNVCLLTGDADAGIAHHTKAARLLNPAVDLAAWGRFRKAAATVRLQHGMVDGAAELLDEARFALRIVGSASDLTALRMAEARLWLLRGDTSRARELIDYCWGDDEVTASPYSAAELEGLSAELAEASGSIAEAAASFRSAAIKFQEGGWLHRSVDMWMRHSELLTAEHPDGGSGRV